MDNHQASDNALRLTLSLDLDSSLDRILTSGDPLHEAVHQSLVRSLAELMEILGIPGQPSVEIAALRQNPMRAGRFMQVSVNGQLLRYPDELLRFVRGYVNGSHSDAGATPTEILAWLIEVSSDRTEAMGLNHAKAVEFLSLACLDIIKRQPAILLGLPQVDDYVASLPAPIDVPSGTYAPDPTGLLPVLSTVLNLKISIADKQAVANVLGQAGDKSQEAVSEDLIVALRPDVVEIQLPQEYLRQLTTAGQENRFDFFTSLRDGLFLEMGTSYPSFRFVPDAHLKPNGFTFKINHLTTLPLVGLRPDQCLVNDSFERLKALDNQATAALNPATGLPGGIIGLAHKGAVEGIGLTTWDQMGYLTLCFAEALRKNSACFVDRRTTQSRLEQLKSNMTASFPTLVETTQSKVSIERLTRVLRGLVAEEISIRNLRLILERLLDYDYSLDDASRFVILDDRPTTYGPLDTTQRNDLAGSDLVHLVSFVRAGMKRQISNKHARGTNTLVVYLLHLDIEKLLARREFVEAGTEQGNHLEESERDKILEATRAEIAHLPATIQVPAILTSIDVRPSARQVIASEFPRIPVLSYHELPPDLNIQPVARISLESLL